METTHGSQYDMTAPDGAKSNGKKDEGLKSMRPSRVSGFHALPIYL